MSCGGAAGWAAYQNQGYATPAAGAQSSWEQPALARRNLSDASVQLTDEYVKDRRRPDRAIDALLRGIGLLQPVPGFLAAGLLTADLRLAAGIFHAVEVDLDRIAHLLADQRPGNG